MVGAWLVAGAFLAGNVVHRGEALASEGGPEGRYWEDMDIARVWYFDGVFPFASYEVTAGIFSKSARAAAFRTRFGQATREAGIRPWQFWRTVSPEGLRPEERFPVRQADDRGRVAALAAGFRLLGGLAPYLLPWLAPLLALPLLLWILLEMEAAGRGRAGAVLAVLLGASPFVAETLALGYSPAGFYLVGLLALVPLAVFACCRPGPTFRALMVRIALAALALAIAVACRRGTVLLLPGFALALALGVARARPRPLVGLGRFVLGGALLVAPALATSWALLRAEDPAAHTEGAHRRHNPWMNVWEGLGDFDDRKGYVWSDRRAYEFLFEVAGEERALGQRSERLFRRKVLQDVGADPRWYLRILARRTFATLGQTKLWPWGPTSGLSIAPATRAGEGAIDSYYSLVTPADWIGVGRWRLELPVPLLLLPAVALLVLALRRAERIAEATALLCLAAAALVTPVLISTASALETQAFVIVHFAAAAFLAGALLDHSRQRAS